MLDRVKFGWRVHLQGEDGRTTSREVWAYWSPEKEGVSEAVGESAAAMEYMANRKKVHFLPISLERIAA